MIWLQDILQLISNFGDVTRFKTVKKSFTFLHTSSNQENIPFVVATKL